MKHAPHSYQHHDLYRKYKAQDSEISGLLGECGLRPGGLAFLAVPIVEGWVKTYEDPDITSERGREIHFGQKDHVRMYGRDFRERVVASGFTLREFPAVEPDVRKYGLLRGERLFLAVKERKPTSSSNSD